MILSDVSIHTYLREGELAVEPLHPDSVRENGVDLRWSGQIKDLGGGHMLGLTEEYIRLPNFMAGFCCLRSSFARRGILAAYTAVDAGFEGKLVIELFSGLPGVIEGIQPGERFLHLVLAVLTSPVRNPYRGRYQGQKEIQL